jgi:hypothetical protein
MCVDVVSKASGDQDISPIVFSQIDGSPQSVKVAVAELQYRDADSFQEFAMLSKVWATFIGQQRRDEFDIIWAEQYGDALFDPGRQWSTH